MRLARAAGPMTAGMTALVLLARAPAVESTGASIPADRMAAEPVKYVMPGGLTVIVRREPGEPTLAADLFVKVGAAQESAIPAGSAGMLARMMLTEAAHPTIRSQIEFLDDQVGGGLSVDPGEDSTLFSVLTTPDRLNQALDLLAFVATKPRLRAADVETERRRVDDEKPPDPFDLAMEAMGRRVYPDTRLGLPVLGDAASRMRITPEILDRLWNDRYRLGDMVVVVAGDLDPQAVSDRAGAAFRKKIDPGPGAPMTEVQPGSALLESEGVIERPLTTGAVAAGVRVPGAADPRFPALGVLSALLGGGKGSRLFHALRDQAGIGYEIGAWNPARAHNGYLAGYVLADAFRPSPEGDEPILDSARKILLREMSAVAAGDWTDAELGRARRYAAGSYLLRHQRVAERAYLLGWWESIGVGYQEDRDYPRQIEKVTRADLSALARDLLRRPASLELIPDEFRAPGAVGKSETRSSPAHSERADHPG